MRPDNAGSLVASSDFSRVGCYTIDLYVVRQPFGLSAPKAEMAAMADLVTLHHFTNPIWLIKTGGWENEAVVPAFRRFAERVVRELGDLCSRWFTMIAA